MILTLSWKEFREHWPIWITMVIASVGLGLFLGQLSTSRDGVSIAALSVLGMAATYGVVCGAMMFAGEREAGTMVFLDIFLGRRDLIWLWKFMIGLVLTLTQALVVAGVLVYLKQSPPEWLPIFVGLGGSADQPFWNLNLPQPGQAIWFLVLPVLTMEAYAWGMLGSALSRRVVNGAACAALMAAPLLLLVMCTPPPLFLGIRLVAAIIALVISGALFLNQSRETQQGPPPRPEEAGPLRPLRRRRRHANWTNAPLPVILVDPAASAPRAPIILEEVPDEPDALPLASIIVDDVPAAPQAAPLAPILADGVPAARSEQPRLARREPRFQDAQSSLQVLLWLAFSQAWILFGILGAAAIIIGFFVPSQGQVLWPLATLLLGVVCGTAAFAQEQSDLSYQFLAAQHFPLKVFWNVKILFWLIVAVTAALLALGSGALLILLNSLTAPGAGPGAAPGFLPGRFNFGSLRVTMGPVLFFGVWLVYGFCIAQVFVLLCRKRILAALVSGLVSAAALGLWLPSVLCWGMSGWQVWLPPLAMLLATRFLVRPWAAGRIKDLRPSAALIGIGLVCLAWAGLVFSLRAWEVPDVGEPLDRAAFAKSIPTGKDNKAASKIEEALAEARGFRHQDGLQREPKEGPWLPALAEATRLPVGVIVTPTGDGQQPILRHLPDCRNITEKLRLLSQEKLTGGQPESAFDHLAQIMALSRNLRNKASLDSYLVGALIEEKALDSLDLWLAHGKPTTKLLQHVLDELNRHAAETPPALDCLNTECFRAGGALANPTAWTFFSGEAPARIPERWLAGGIAFSLDTPWENQRATRLWRIVWAGLYRNLQTPHWQLPDPGDGGKIVRPVKETTRRILDGWLPPADGPAAAMTVPHLASLLDASWLSDEKLFCNVKSLRMAGTRSRWRVDSSRLAAALSLYQIKEGKPAAILADLVPNYLPNLPVDPYSGQDFHYRISNGEQIDVLGVEKRIVRPGQGILWSTGPDRLDQGGLIQGAHFELNDPQWERGGFDLITVIPHWLNK